MFETLSGLVSDNPEATAEIGRLATVYKNETDQSKSKIISLTTQFNEIKAEKDLYLKGNQLVKSALGIDHINDEVVTQRLSELGNTKSAKELATKLAEKDAQIEQVKKDSKAALTSFQIEFESEKALNAISQTLTDDPVLRRMFSEELVKNVGISEGKISPMQTVGDQRIPIMQDGKPIGLSEYANQMLDGSHKAFKKPTTKNSAGPTGGAGGGGQNTMARGDFDKMPNGDKHKFVTDGGKIT